MFEKQIIDKQERLNFFVWMSNRGIKDKFPMISDDPASIYNRAYEEISMGYTSLLIYERLAILQDQQEFILPNAYACKTDIFENLLFVQQDADTEHVSYMGFEPLNRYQNLEEAIAAGREMLQKKQQRYPEQLFTVVCAGFIINHNWH